MTRLERGAQLRALVKQRKSVKEIAEVLGVSHQRVSQLLQAYGLHAKPHRVAAMKHESAQAKQRRTHKARVSHLVAEGRTAQDLQAILGHATVSSIYAYLKRHGLKARTGIKGRPWGSK